MVDIQYAMLVVIPVAITSFFIGRATVTTNVMKNIISGGDICSGDLNKTEDLT